MMTIKSILISSTVGIYKAYILILTYVTISLFGQMRK